MRYSPLFLLCLFLTACGSGKPKPEAVVVDNAKPDSKPAEPPKPPPKTVDLSEFGYRAIIDVPGDLQIDPQPDGSLVLKKQKNFEFRIDRRFDGGNPLAEPVELDVNHASSFFGSELDPAQRIHFDNFEQAGIRTLEGQLTPGKATYRVSARGPYTEADIGEMISILNTARVDDAIKKIEQRQEEAAKKIAAAKIRIVRDDRHVPTLILEKPLSKDLMAAVLDIPDLRGLIFREGYFKDADLEAFTPLKNLETLELEGTGFTDKGFEAIKKWQWLRELRLLGTQIAGTGFSHLQGSANLRELRAAFSPLRNSGLALLSGLPIEKINLNATDVTDTGIEALTRCANLRDLRLFNNRVEGKAIPGLAKLPLLTLVIVNCPFDTSSYKALAACPKLENLFLGGPSLSEQKFDWVASLMELKVLVLLETDLPPKVFETVVPGPKLKNLHVEDANVPEAAVRAFRLKYPEIVVEDIQAADEPDFPPPMPPRAIADLPAPEAKKKIDQLGGQYTLNEELEGKPIATVSLKKSAATNLDLAELRALDQLTSLDLSGCAAITDEGLPYLSNLSNLKTLKLKGTHVGGNGLVALKNLKKLAVLELPDQEYTLRQVNPLLALPALERINCLKGENALFELRRLAPAGILREIDLAATKTPFYDIERELKYFPKLEVLRVREVWGNQLAAIGKLVELQILDLREVQYSRDEDWKSLSSLRELREFDAQSRVLDDTKLPFLRELSKLEKLSLHSPRITDKGLARMSSFGPLKELSLAGCSITDALMASIGDLKELEELDLVDTPITDKSLVKLKEIEGLRTLRLGSPTFTAKGLNDLRGHKAISILELNGVKFVDGTAEAVRGLNGLIEVHLPGCEFKIADIETILALPELRKLQLPASLSDAEKAKITEASKKHTALKIYYE